MACVPRLLVCAVLLSLWTAVSARPVDAQEPGRRVALLIANGAYQAGSVLKNPVNDARLVSQALRRAGFETVDVRADLGIAAFRNALREFRGKANGADVALVYYAGHGIEANRRNWLIPTDAVLASELDLTDEAVDLDRVLADVSGARLRVVILDACRDNPLGRSWRSGTRTFQGGLAPVEADDVLVIYAAAPGQKALDAPELPNSPFATALARRLVEPGLPLQLLGNAVRDDVLRATASAQRPFVSASMTAELYYLAAKPTTTAPVPVATPAPDVAAPAAPSTDAVTLEALTWQGALSANTLEGYEDYLRQYPQGRFRVQAQGNVARLRAAAPVPAPAPAVTTPSTPVAASASVSTPVAAPAPATTQEDASTPPAPAPAPREPADLDRRVGPMVLIPAGSFLMGSPRADKEASKDERPQRTVTIAAFELGKYEVTRGQFRAFVEATGYVTDAERDTDLEGLPEYKKRCGSKEPRNWRDPGFVQTDAHPVVCVSWRDAQAYAKWLSETTGQRYRLPSEAEWEYAARAGTTTPYWAGGSGVGPREAQILFSEVTGTVPVGSYAANPFGLHDTTGNAEEWVQDCPSDDYRRAPVDGSADEAGVCGLRVKRGGGWKDAMSFLRSAMRSLEYAAGAQRTLGFRLARSLH